MSAASIDPDAVTAELLTQVLNFCQARRVNVWATGGFLRDRLLGRAPRDIDISVDADPLVIGPELAQAIRAHFVVLDEDRRHARLVPRSDGTHIDLMGLRASDIESDLRERDFTVDALAAPVEGLVAGDMRLLDPMGGLNDLNTMIVRATGEKQLLDDPLRLLRGVRIATVLNFEIEAQTRELLAKHAAQIRAAAAERVREELMALFRTDHAARGVRMLDEFGLLTVMIPELDVMRDVEQPKEHYHDVFGHAVATVEALDFLLGEGPPLDEAASLLWSTLWEGLTRPGELRAHLRADITPVSPRVSLLKWCGLLHDVGKPATKSIEPDGRIRFFGHGVEGAAIAARLMKRLRFSSREIDIVRRMIEAHLRPVQMAQQGPPTRRAIFRFFRDTGDAGVDTLLLSLGDHLGTVGPRLSIEGFRQHVALIAHILNVWAEQPDVIAPKLLVNGADLMRELSIGEGPEVGQLLGAIKEAQAAGEITTRDEALALARRVRAKSGPAG